MEQRASGLSGLAYCRRAGINSKTFYYWQNVIQKELLASKTQYADVVETLSPSSEPLKPSKVEHETSAPKTPATSVEVAHETVEPPAESTSIASPSSVAHVMVQKYQHSMPLYRQEREWKEIGIPLSRATLANWVIRPADDWLMPLAARLRQGLLEQDVIHAYETPVQVHKEKGRKNPAKSYMWVFSSGEYEQAHPIRLYECQPGRSSSYAEDFLKGFNGILQTDGYTGYQKVPCQAHALCGAHARRYFVEVIPPDLREEYLLSSTYQEAIEQINELFAIDKRLAERPIRNFTIGRKNWLFSDSPKGAKASADVYSIIETAKANGLNPFQYLKYLFEHLPNADIQRHPEHLDDVLPWNETIQQNCK